MQHVKIRKKVHVVKVKIRNLVLNQKKLLAQKVNLNALNQRKVSLITEQLMIIQVKNHLAAKNLRKAVKKAVQKRF